MSVALYICAALSVLGGAALSLMTMESMPSGPVRDGIAFAYFAGGFVAALMWAALAQINSKLDVLLKRTPES